MTLHDMSKMWGIPFSRVHAAAIKVNGGPLGRGRKKWTSEQVEAIKAIAVPPGYLDN